MVTVLFYILLGLAGLALIYVLLTRNLVRALIGLFFVLLAQAALYAFARADVLAVSQVIVYVGGVLVLLLFGVMLTGRRLSAAQATVGEMPRTELRSIGAGAVVVAVLMWALVQAVPPEALRAASAEAPRASATLARQIGHLSLTDYLLGFELLSIVLLIALIGAARIARA